MNYKLKKYVKKKIEESTILVPTDNNIERNFIELNDTGTVIFEKLECEFSVKKIISELSELYMVDTEAIRSDVEEFIQSLSNYGVLSIEGHCTTMMNDIEYDSMDAYSKMQSYYFENEKPFKFFLELTYNCNLRCPHCYIHEELTKESDFIDKYIVLKTIDQIENLGGVEVVITGGEATLHPDLFEILEYATRKNLLVTLLTNGLNLYDEEHFDKLMSIPLADVRISLYGVSEVHNSFVHKAGAFETSFEVLKKLRKLKGIGTGVYVLTNFNFDCLEEITKLAKTNGVPLVFTPTIMATSRGGKKPLDYRLDYEQLKYFTENFLENLNGSICTAGISRFRINPKGDVNPCEMMRNIKLGNIFEEELHEIMGGERRKEWITFFKKINSENDCSDCSNKKICNYCPGLFYVESGSFMEKSSFVCMFTNIKNEYMKQMLGE